LQKCCSTENQGGGQVSFSRLLATAAWQWDHDHKIRQPALVENRARHIVPRRAWDNELVGHAIPQMIHELPVIEFDDLHVWPKLGETQLAEMSMGNHRSLPLSAKTATAVATAAQNTVRRSVFG